MTDVNLDELAKHFNISMDSKKFEDPKDGELRRFKNKYLFISTIIAFALMFSVCVFVMVAQSNFSYTGTALNGIIGLTMALAGYCVRGKTH